MHPIPPKSCSPVYPISPGGTEIRPPPLPPIVLPVAEETSDRFSFGPSDFQKVKEGRGLFGGFGMKEEERGFKALRTMERQNLSPPLRHEGASPPLGLPPGPSSEFSAPPGFPPKPAHSVSSLYTSPAVGVNTAVEALGGVGEAAGSLSLGGHETGRPGPVHEWAVQEPEEPVRGSPDLPVLEKFDPATSAITAGDWLVVAAPTLKSLSQNAALWWEDVLHCANGLYKAWVTSSPLERLRLRPDAFLSRHATGKFSRLDAKASTLILKAIQGAGDIKEEVVTSRMLSTTGLIYKILCKFQHGGSPDWPNILQLSDSRPAQRTCTEAT